MFTETLRHNVSHICIWRRFRYSSNDTIWRCNRLQVVVRVNNFGRGRTGHTHRKQSRWSFVALHRWVQREIIASAIATSWSDADVWHFTLFYVKPEYRLRGFLTRMVGHLMSSKDGIFFLEAIKEDMATAYRRKCGFRNVANTVRKACTAKPSYASPLSFEGKLLQVSYGWLNKWLTDSLTDWLSDWMHE